MKYQRKQRKDGMSRDKRKGGSFRANRSRKPAQDPLQIPSSFPKKIMPLRLQGVYTDRMRNLYTESHAVDKRFAVYGERIIMQDGSAYRMWDPSRSKLGAAVRLGISQVGIKPGSSVLYLGCASGTTVSHVADMVGNEGRVYGLDLSPEVMRQFFRVVDQWQNVAPLVYSASHPEEYMHLVELVDVVFQDIAQRDQARIFLENCQAFLKKGGFGLLSVKAKSIDVTAQPKMIFDQVEKELASAMTVVDKRVLEPYQKGHCLFVVKKKGD
ncbi:MAG: fibrillarin-like rRNA/tRNA 2'-O-methyltransferase [Nanoarchaeota archaeon]